jgi:hypothetical protein
VLDSIDLLHVDMLSPMALRDFDSERMLGYRRFFLFSSKKASFPEVTSVSCECEDGAAAVVKEEDAVVYG